MRRPVYEEHYDGISIVEYVEMELEKPAYFILGLPDTGLVGAIATSHLTRALNMEEVGGIESYRYLPPIAVIHKGEPKPPLRIFKKDNIVALVPEVAIPASMAVSLPLMLLDYVQKKGFDYIISLTGVGTPNRMSVERPSVYWLASSNKAKSLIERVSISMFGEGILVGPYAIVLKESIKRKLNNLVLLAEAYMEFPDPEAAAMILSALSQILGVEIDVRKLMEEAELIRLKTKELMKSTKRMLAQMGKGYEYQFPLLYS